jgi:hypothetical protein
MEIVLLYWIRMRFTGLLPSTRTCKNKPHKLIPKVKDCPFQIDLFFPNLYFLVRIYYHICRKGLYFIRIESHVNYINWLLYLRTRIKNRFGIENRWWSISPKTRENQLVFSAKFMSVSLVERHILYSKSSDFFDLWFNFSMLILLFIFIKKSTGWFFNPYLRRLWFTSLGLRLTKPRI